MTNDRQSYYDEYNKGEESSTLKKAIAIKKNQGLKMLIKGVALYAINAIVEGITYTIVRRNFEVHGQKFRYFLNRYNAINTERCVELPIAMNFIFGNTGHGASIRDQNSFKILELGNTLSHYYEFEHVIIDKYEKRRGVINIDIDKYDTDAKFDLIISISTVEHVGFDEPEKERGKPLRAIIRLRDMLLPGGRMLITVPLGDNPEIDKMIEDDLLPFTEKYYLKRVGFANTWRETTLDDAIKYKYGSRYPHANSLAVLIYERSINERDV